MIFIPLLRSGSGCIVDVYIRCRDTEGGGEEESGARFGSRDCLDVGQHVGKGVRVSKRLCQREGAAHITHLIAGCLVRRIRLVDRGGDIR